MQAVGLFLAELPLSFAPTMPDQPSQTAQPPSAPETSRVVSDRVTCDGGAATGHPRVYLRIGEAGFVECPYCDKRFILEKPVGG